MIEVKPFVMAYHFQTLLSWLLERDAYMPNEAEMPETGFIAYSDGEPVAALFIRLVEGYGAQLDGLTSNPKAPANVRNEALDSVIYHCIERAKQLDLKQLLAFSLDEHTLTRVERIGFKPIEHKAIIFDLTK